MKLQNVNFQNGITKMQIEELETALQFAFNPSELTREISSDMAELLVEQGKYNLALQLGLKHNFSIAKSYLFLGEIKRFEEFLKENITLAESNLALALRLRMNGEAHKALKLIEAEILPHAQNEKSFFAIDVYLQAGSAAFNSSQYQKAFDFYKMAYEISEELGFRGKMAISAFNAAVAANHLKMELECKTWLWYSESILNQYYLPSLKSSIEIFHIENNFAIGNFEETVLCARKFLEKSDLNLVQKVLGLQTLAKALLELGYVIEAESISSQARYLIQKNRFYQYEIYQLSLEGNIELLTNRKLTRDKSVNSPLNAPDHRAHIEWKIVCARKAVLHNDLARALRLYSEVQSASMLIEDLAVLAGGISLPQIKTARGAEALLYNLIKENRWSQVKNFCEHFKSQAAQNVWLKSLMLMAEGFVLMSAKNLEAALANFEEMIALSEDAGLEKQTTIAIGISALLNPSRQAHWLERINRLDETDKSFFSNFFVKGIGRDLLLGKWVVFQDQKRLMPEFIEETHTTAGAELVINQVKGSLVFKGSELPISGQSVLFQIVLKLAQSQKQGLSKEELVKSVWGYEYDPSIHDSTIYANIRRLRELIPIELYQSNYRISTSLQWCLISDDEKKSNGIEVSSRQNDILKLFSEKKFVSRRDLVNFLQISERTALRELTELVEKGILSKQGMGRAVQYSLSQKSEAV